ncbi:MAG TPA: TIGR01777 family oxidoreductase [Acidimicrobiales bacterium]|jgi:hypothetical protein|nr:TIGR01777 family oxidoreductase [Acidimicrobiales bacterium]
MRVAVTGAHGFIGRALVPALERDGHEVVRVTRDASGELDLGVLYGSDAVIHLAGEGVASKRWTPEQKRAVLESRTRGTTRVSEAIASMERKPRVLLSGSAVGYYGDRGDEVLTEQSSPGNDFLAEVCVQWEASTAAAQEAGIRVAHLRTGIVVGKSGGAVAKTLPLFKLGLGGRIGSGRQYWSWISLTDEIGAIRFLLDHDVRGPVNLTGPAPVTNAEFTKSVGRALHRPTMIPVPKFGPALLLGREAAAAVVHASQRVEPIVLAGAGYRFVHPTVDAATRAELT